MRQPGADPLSPYSAALFLLLAPGEDTLIRMYQAVACPLDPFTWIRQFEANAFQMLEQNLDLGNIRLWKRRLSNGRQIALQMLKPACTKQHNIRAVSVAGVSVAGVYHAVGAIRMEEKFQWIGRAL